MIMDYGKIIKEYREKNLLSQQEFADLLGVSVVTVSRWEQSKYSPTLKMKKKLKELRIINVQGDGSIE